MVCFKHKRSHKIKMKITRKSRRVNWKYFLILILVLALGVGIFAYIQNQANSDSNTPTESNDTNNDSTKTGSSEIDQPGKSSSAPVVDDPTGGTVSEPDVPSKSIESPQIARANQSGSSVKVVATLKKQSTGKCEARFSKANQSTISRSTTVEVGPTYYVCSFSVPSSSFPENGVWELVVLHKVGNKVANSSITEVSIQR